MPRKPNKYAMYELSVQSPDYHAEWFAEIFKEIGGKDARSMREDFCGTFALSCEWVKLNEANTALGVDLDPEPLAYGRKVHLPELTASQRKRIQILKANVLSVKAPKVDLILACNFSFYIFKQRATLIEYFRKCHQSLAKSGMLMLDLSGGPGMIEEMKERKKLRDKKLGRFTYVWEQKSFDPITHDGKYAIHFKTPDGYLLEDAFTYDWRLWTIPEVRECLAEAGFPESCVYWETMHKGEGTGEYIRLENGDNAHAWIAYVVGMKK
jgi:hypothetical protein